MVLSIIFFYNLPKKKILIKFNKLNTYITLALFFYYLFYFCLYETSEQSTIKYIKYCLSSSLFSLRTTTRNSWECIYYGYIFFILCILLCNILILNLFIWRVKSSNFLLFIKACKNFGSVSLTKSEIQTKKSEIHPYHRYSSFLWLNTIHFYI